MKNPPPSVPALERGLDLLEWMLARSEPVTLTQIAHGTSHSVSEVQRPVGCLVQRGYLTRTPAGAYVVSGRLFRLAAAHPPFLQLQRAAQPLMVEFAQETGQSIHLCVPDGDAGLLISDVPGGGLVRISLQVGARLDATTTVSGRLLLAAGALTLPKPPGRKLREHLDRITQRGFENAPSAHAEGIEDTGVLIRAADGTPVATLTTSELRLRQPRRPPTNLVTTLQAKAKLLEARL